MPRKQGLLLALTFGYLIMIELLLSMTVRKNIASPAGNGRGELGRQCIQLLAEI